MKLKFQLENSKLGKIGHMSTKCPFNCWYCYGDKLVNRFPVVKDNIELNSKLLRIQELPDIPKSRGIVRMYSTKGDFETIEIVNKWYRLAKRFPDKTIYGYTKRWQTKSFLPALNKLRKLNNVILRASVDSNTGYKIPNGWIMAGLLESDTIDRLKGKLFKICNFSNDKKQCDKCKWCFDKDLELYVILFPKH